MMNPIPCTLLVQAGRAAAVLLGVLLVSACSTLAKGEVSLDLGIKDRGVASWYGDAFHGKLTANGEVFDKTAYTAAHRKLPLGSIIRVMNLDNGRIVRVRITDRGPYVRGRMLDLSEAAAQMLDMVEAGTAAVQIEVIGDQPGMLPVLQIRRALAPHDAATASQPFADGLERHAVPARTMPPDVWHVRRQRRFGVLHGSHDPAPPAGSFLITC